MDTCSRSEAGHQPHAAFELRGTPQSVEKREIGDSRNILKHKEGMIPETSSHVDSLG